jgi:hypothetical protein
MRHSLNAECHTSTQISSGLILKFQNFLLTVLLLEILLGGNGYLTEILGVRFRVILSGVCLTWVASRMLSSHSAIVSHQIFGLFFLFLGTTIFGLMIGLINGNSQQAIAAELKPLSYFPLLLFFAFAIRTKEDINQVIRLIVICGVLQATLFLGIMLAAHLGIIRYSAIYMVLRESDEFIFRHNPEEEFFIGFLYKGAFHLPIATLFLLLDPIWKNRWLAVIVLAAILLTETRGLMAALFISLFVGVILLPKKKWIAVFSTAVGLIVIILLLTDLSASLQRQVSDDIRLGDINTIRSELDPAMILFGRGLGAPIGDRERIEMNYLEIFFKQGVIGLLLWVIVFLVNFSAFMRIKGPMRQRALVFHLSVIFVYVATATNTFLTGSIGMSIVLISTAALLAMNRIELHHQDTTHAGC